MRARERLPGSRSRSWRRASAKNDPSMAPGDRVRGHWLPPRFRKHHFRVAPRPDRLLTAPTPSEADRVRQRDGGTLVRAEPGASRSVHSGCRASTAREGPGRPQRASARTTGRVLHYSPAPEP
jgi:hypothetical protein